MGSYLPSTRQTRIIYFFNLEALQKAFQKPPAKGRKEHLMKLGQYLRAIITKRGRTVLNQAGSTWDVFEALENILSKLTDKEVEIAWEDDCTFNVYVDKEHYTWTGDDLTTYEIYLLEETLQALISKDYRLTLIEE